MPSVYEPVIDATPPEESVILGEQVTEETNDYETKLEYLQKNELLTAQLQVAEATILSQKANITSLETRIKELEQMLKDNPTAQEVLTRNIAKVSKELDILKTGSHILPEGLSMVEGQAILSLRQAQQTELETKHETLKKYIRGEL